ncbi:MAG: hypothetical protein ACJ8FY_06135 [Gemmataceae bacterium]
MDERDPVRDDEFVYRRIHRNFYDATISPPIRSEAFRPNKNDDTGLSVFRAQFLQPFDTLATIEAGKQNDYYVVTLAVSDLKRLGLTVMPEPDPAGPPGHAVIPELSYQAYHASKKSLKVVQFELVKLASTAVVLAPS